MSLEKCTLVKDFLQLGLTYVVSELQQEQGLKCPRATLAIACALHSTFPESVSLDAKNLKMLDLFSQLMIAANEYVDIGISAAIKRGKQETFYDLLELENRTFNKLLSLKLSFAEIYPEKKGVFEMFLSDLILLSENRSLFEDKMSTFLEIDSAIFEIGCVYLLAGQQLEHGSHISPLDNPLTDADYLIDKYSPILSNYNGPQNSDFLNRLRSLHAISMLLKIDDDLRDNGLDRLLGLPNWKEWQSLSQGSIPQYRRDLVFLAQQGITLPPFSLQLIQWLSDRSSKIKAKKNSANVPSETPISQHPYFTGGSTTFRHELLSSGKMDAFI
jgi:hypothetical protein